MSQDIDKNIDGIETKDTRTKRIWGIIVFGIIGATAITSIRKLWRSIDWSHVEAQAIYEDEARRRYMQRLHGETEEERIRRLINSFSRENKKYRRGYERSRGNSYGEYFQNFQWKELNLKAHSTHGKRSNYKDTTHSPANYSFSHHYAVLGLARSRKTPYTDDEIKTAFRRKAKQYHPDQNQENKEVAEAKFKEISSSYEAIKSERKNNIK